jgi:hypothetical protein
MMISSDPCPLCGTADTLVGGECAHCGVIGCYECMPAGVMLCVDCEAQTPVPIHRKDLRDATHRE